MSKNCTLLLVFVAYHPSGDEVDKLQSCLDALSSEIGYAVVVNDHHLGEPIDRLRAKADQWLSNVDNPGYGTAVNRLIAS